MGLRFAPQTAILRDFAGCVGLIRSHPEHGQEANIRGRPASLERNRRAAIIIDTDLVAALVRDHGRPSGMEGKRIRPFAGRRQLVWLAKESPCTRRPTA